MKGRSFNRKVKIDSNLLNNDPALLAQFVEFEIRKYFDYAKNGGETINDGKAILHESFSQDPIDLKELSRLVSDEILGKAVYKARPEYLSFIDNGTNAANILASPLISLMQQNMTTQQTDSPGATMNEISLLLLMRKLAGYPVPETPKNLLEIGGNFVSGGMMGNMEAVLVARNRLFPDAQTKGIYESRPVKIILPYFASHYSLWNAFGWMGFGENNAVYVDTKNFRYDTKKLASTLKQLKKEGHPILMAVASLGDSFSMGIENVKAVSEICGEHGVWLHGDGANGANLIFSQKHKHNIDGISRCDSITLDPHKALGLNYPCSIFLCKDIHAFNSVVSHWNIVNRPDSLDLGMITPFLNSRGVDSLRLWLAIRLFGLRGLGEILDRKIDTTRKIYNELGKLGKSVFLWNDPQYLSILFQVVPRSMAPLAHSSLDDAVLNKLSEHQNDFKSFLRDKTGIHLHSFALPTATLSGDEKDKNSYCTVLALQNGHEHVPQKIVDDLMLAIKEFLTGKDLESRKDHEAEPVKFLEKKSIEKLTL